MKTFLKNLFEYQHHFTPKLIDLVEEHQDLLPEKTIGLLSHIINAHQIWNARILGIPETGVFQLHAMDTCREFEQENQRNSLRIIEEFEPAHIISYTNTKGQAFENSVGDILFHVINHTTHHRGQIVAAVRAAGGEPFASDFIFYSRKIAI
ncbi:MAG: DinB family protein [Saprospiraceae bacterium]|nr:DinB family protein [Saprospiraceae bacterium]